MNIANVYEKLNNAIVECKRESDNAEVRKNWLLGMANGIELVLKILAEEGVTPETWKETIIPFKGKET